MTATEDVLALYPWVGERFQVLKIEQGGRFVRCVCPLRPHDAATLRFWVRDGNLVFGCYGRCNKLEILRAGNATWKDCFPGGRVPDRTRREETAHYPYRDERGVLLYQKVRIEPGFGGKDKTFRQRRPSPGGGWSYDLAGVRRVLYRLPELLAADPRTPVAVVAGEKDCESLAAVGVEATTNSDGEYGAWQDAYSAVLAGRPVVVVPDADGPGRRHADEVCGSLVRHGVRSLTAAELPGAKDSTAFLAALRRRGVADPGELRKAFWRAAARSAPRWCPLPLGAV